MYGFHINAYSFSNSCGHVYYYKIYIFIFANSHNIYIYRMNVKKKQKEKAKENNYPDSSIGNGGHHIIAPQQDINDFNNINNK